MNRLQPTFEKSYRHVNVWLGLICITILLGMLALVINNSIKTIKEQLNRSNAHLLGIVFNKISERSAHSYYDYQYRSLYSPKYYGDYIAADKEPNTGSRSRKIMSFFEHGELPPEVEQGVQSAITAIRTQPRNMVSRIKKNRKNGRNAESDKIEENE